MVWGVCRRTVRDTQLAEDAFQAVFVVLVRKADGIRPPAAVGGWLHAVAVHTSLRARAMADRRRRREILDSTIPDCPAPDVAEPTDPDLLRRLDEEIARLPDTLRAAVALCELGGVSRRDAAKRLGVAEGTLSSRLAAARKQLAARLRSRGATLPVGGVAALLASGTAGAVPPVIPTHSDTVSALADGAIRTMFLTKLKVLTAGLLAAVALLGVGLSAYTGAASEPRPPAPQPRRNAPIPAAKAKEGLILVGVQEDSVNRLEVRTPKGEKVATVPLPPHPMCHAALSRDGKRAAVWSWDVLRIDQANRAGPGQKIPHTGTLLVFEVEKPEKPLVKLEGIHSGGCVFAPDGNSLYVNELAEPDPAKEGRENAVHRFDLKTLKKAKIDLPADQMVMDLSPDGKTLLTNSSTPVVKGEYHVAPYLVPLATLKPELLSKACVGGTKFSPDGKKVLGHKFLDPKDTSKQELVILDVATGKETVVKLGEDTLFIRNAAWSPDGMKLVVQRDVITGAARPPGPAAPVPVGGGGAIRQLPEHKPEVTVRKLDGSDPKPLLELKGQVHIFGLDWK